MQDIRQLIKRIEDKAAGEVDAVESSYADKVNQLQKDFKSKRSEYLAQENDESGRLADLKKRETITLKKLHMKKELINMKRSMIDGVFEKAVRIMQDLPAEKYQKLMEAILKEIVVSGTELVLPAKGNERLTRKFISSVNKKYGWSLKLSDHNDRAKDGFILVDSECETAVDWSTIREYVRQKKEDMIIRKLFA